MFSARSLTVLALPLRSMIHYEGFSGYDVREGPNFLLSHPAVQVPQHHSWSALNNPPDGVSILAENQSVMNVKVYSWTLRCVRWSIHFSFCQSHTFLITVALKRALKWGSRSPPMLIFFSGLHWLLWVSCISIWILESAREFLPKSQVGFLTDCAESADQFGECCHCNNTVFQFLNMGWLLFI